MTEMRVDCLRNRSRKAQHLIEFALVVPILMMLIFIIVEAGMAINARLTLSEAVKAALVEVNNLNTIGGGATASTKASKIEDYIESQVRAYLLHHNIPNTGSVSAKINASDNYAAVLVSYEYNPVFTLPGMGSVIPDTYHFSSSQSLNPHIFKSNVLPSSGSLYRTTADLSRYYYNSSNQFIDAGELINNDARKYTAFLVDMYELSPNYADYKYARLVSWEGYDLLPPNLRINLKTGTLEVRSPYYITNMSTPWVNTKIPYVWVATALGINHLIYIKYNTDRIKMLDTASVYYKLSLNDKNVFYNLGIPTCSQIYYTYPATPPCEDNLMGTNTINERALRFNPRFGSGVGSPPTWIDTYIIGTAEPVKITSLTPHPFQHINSHYFSYSDNYTSWDNNYLITISSPFVEGLKSPSAPLPNSIYNSQISDNTKNPFYKPFEYRLKLCESNPEGASCTRGTYLGPAAADGSQDGNIDANYKSGSATFDKVEANQDNFYVVDIFDVIIDSDGDGIPDAWDKDPSYFDVNVNGILDGNEIDPTLFKTNNRCNDGAGEPYKYEDDPADPCDNIDDVVTINNVADFTLINIDLAASSPFHNATPLLVSSTSTSLSKNFAQTVQTGSSLKIPRVNMMLLYIYNSPDGQALYYKISDANIAVGQKLTRKFPTWHDPTYLNIVSSCTNSAGSFDGCKIVKRTIKKDSNFLHLFPDYSGTNIAGFILQQSKELSTLTSTGGRFAPDNKVTPTPPLVW